MEGNKILTDRIRNSNLEILRIISMLLIVAHHYSVHGFSTIEMKYSLNRYVVGILSLGGKLGVACFILISGYFMVYSKFTIKKLIKLVAETWFYSMSIGILFLFVLTPVEPIGLNSLIKAMLPIGFSEYWFMTDYIMLMLMSPVLNMVIASISKEGLQKLLAGAIVCWSVLPGFIGANYGYNDLVWFMVLYMIAGYIRKYVDFEKKNASKHFMVGIISYLLVILSNVMLIFLGHITDIDIFTNKSAHFRALNSPFILITAVELLIGFTKLKPNYNKFVNILASATLGVYLIHSNNLVRPYLWRVILKNADMYNSPLLILHALISIVTVYMVCSCIDLIRQVTVGKIFVDLVNKYFDKISEKMKDITKFICKIIQNLVFCIYK
jgi:surface polysaccharide O-acyltransferase-like enzyme